MKTFALFVLVFISIEVFSQNKLGFTFDIYAFNDIDDVMYLDKSKSLGGTLGIQFAHSFTKVPIAFESELLFYDHLYKLRGPEFRVQFVENNTKFFKFNETINDLGVCFPFAMVYTKNLVQPFIGLQFQYTLANQENQRFYMGSYYRSEPQFLHIHGEDIIRLSAFTWYANAGCYLRLSPKFKLKVNYSLGLNDFVTHSMSPRIVNGVNEGGTTVYATRVQKFQLGVVYYPAWGKKERAEREPKPKRTANERLKEWYQ